MSFTITQSNGKGIITLSGDLTLQHAEEMKKVFIKALLDSDDVSVDFKDVSEVDLACLQVFCSAHRSAVRLKKKVRFGGVPPQIFKNAAKAAGYAHLKGCKLDCEKSCLWIAVAGENNG